MPATYDEVVAAYHAQIEHTNLVRVEYQRRLADETEACARLAERRWGADHYGGTCQCLPCELAAAIRHRASDAKPLSAIPSAPRALPQDRDAAVGGLRDEVLAAMPIIHAGHSGPLEWEQCETLRCRRLRAALARLAPPQRAPAEPGDVTD